MCAFEWIWACMSVDIYKVQKRVSSLLDLDLHVVVSYLTWSFTFTSRNSILEHYTEEGERRAWCFCKANTTRLKSPPLQTSLPPAETTSSRRASLLLINFTILAVRSFEGIWGATAGTSGNGSEMPDWASDALFLHWSKRVGTVHFLGD